MGGFEMPVFREGTTALGARTGRAADNSASFSADRGRPNPTLAAWWRRKGLVFPGTTRAWRVRDQGCGKGPHRRPLHEMTGASRPRVRPPERWELARRRRAEPLQMLGKEGVPAARVLPLSERTRPLFLKRRKGVKHRRPSPARRWRIPRNVPFGVRCAALAGHRRCYIFFISTVLEDDDALP